MLKIGRRKTGVLPVPVVQALLANAAKAKLISLVISPQKEYQMFGLVCSE